MNNVLKAGCIFGISAAFYYLFHKEHIVAYIILFAIIGFGVCLLLYKHHSKKAKEGYTYQDIFVQDITWESGRSYLENSSLLGTFLHVPLVNKTSEGKTYRFPLSRKYVWSKQQNIYCFCTKGIRNKKIPLVKWDSLHKTLHIYDSTIERLLTK